MRTLFLVLYISSGVFSIFFFLILICCLFCLFCCFCCCLRYKRDIKHWKNVQKGKNSKIYKTKFKNYELEYKRTVAENEKGVVLFFHGVFGGFDQSEFFFDLAFGHRKDLGSVTFSRFGYLRSSEYDPEKKLGKSGLVFEEQCIIVKDLIDHLKLKSVYVAGMSAGGPIATKFAELYPENTKGLFVFSGNCPKNPEAPIPSWVFNILVDAYFGNSFIFWLSTTYTPFIMWLTIGVPVGVVRSATKERREFVKNTFLLTSHPSSERSSGLKFDMKHVREVKEMFHKKVQVTTAVFTCEDDSFMNFPGSREMATEFPQGKFVSFKTGGHIFLTNYEEVRKEVDVFLEELDNVRPYLVDQEGKKEVREEIKEESEVVDE